MPGVVTPGWSDPRVDKLPYFGLPERMDGLRVLDIGPAEGFFSFEAERRGAREVVAIEAVPHSLRRFNICREALGSHATGHLCSVYDLNPRAFGTFDLVMFFGVLYHLRHPLLALERILTVCTGKLLMQTASHEVPGAEDVPLAKFHPFGIESGPADNRRCDPTVFWLPNAACVAALLQSAGFQEIESVDTSHGVGAVFRARAPELRVGEAPNEITAPWS
jgi:tRNA (mo5U34)-methyltransferase